jgi:hypothetical protein
MAELKNLHEKSFIKMSPNKDNDRCYFLSEIFRSNINGSNRYFLDLLLSNDHYSMPANFFLPKYKLLSIFFFLQKFRSDQRYD